MKKLLLTSFLLLFSAAAFAQQDKLLTQFWNAYQDINPGAVGLEYKHQATALYRNQWDKVNGAPNTFTANYGIRLDAINSGLGLVFVHDAIGFARQNNAILNYSYHIKLGEKSILALGIGLGIINFGMDPVWIPPTNVQDPSLPTSSSGTNFDMNLGVVYKRDKLSVGFSTTHLNQKSISTVNYSTARHYILFGMYQFDLGTDFYLKPQVVMRTDAVKFSADINVLAYFKNKYWAGMTYRTSDAIAFMVGWDILEKFRIGYSYDLTINQLNNVSIGTHEIVLGLMLK